MAKVALVEYRQNREKDNDDISVGSADSLIGDVSDAYDEMCRAEQVKKAAWSRVTESEKEK